MAVARHSGGTVGAPPVILFMAALAGEFIKGGHIAHEACRLLRQTRRDFELVITFDPPGRIDEFTRSVGWQSQADLPRHYRTAGVCLVPTIAQEGLSRTSVEAMASGIPVIASRIGGLPFTVSDGVTGLLFEPGDPAGLARQIARLLDDAPLRKRMGLAGRQRFEQEFTWETVIERHYRPLLRGIVESTGSRPNRCSVGRTMKICRVAVIYDDRERPETSGSLIVAGRSSTIVGRGRSFPSRRFGAVPHAGFDLYLNIDDGLEYRLPADLRPSAWWAIDTHINFDWCRKKARTFDFVFAAQREAGDWTRKGSPRPSGCHWRVTRRCTGGSRSIKFMTSRLSAMFPRPTGRFAAH